VVERLASTLSRAVHRRRFGDVVTKGQSGDTVSWEQLVAAAGPTFDPLRTGQPRGPVGAYLSPRIYGDYAERERAAADAVIADDRDTVITDEAFEAARDIYQLTRPSYERERARFSADPELGHLHPPQDAEDLLNSACHDLLTALGHVLPEGEWRGRRPLRMKGQ
jgi:hypothetical protein